MGPSGHPFSVDLRGLHEGREELTLTAPVGSLDLPEEALKVDSDVVLDLTLALTGRLLTARGSVHARPEMVCARCLEPFERDLEGSFEVVVRLLPDGLSLEDEEDTPAVLGEDWIAFDVSVREALLLAAPLKPLCREDCKGLCPQCGTNWNESSCDCSRARTDSRWDALKSLLD